MIEYLAKAKAIALEVSTWPNWKKAGFYLVTSPTPTGKPE